MMKWNINQPHILTSSSYRSPPPPFSSSPASTLLPLYRSAPLASNTVAAHATGNRTSMTPSTKDTPFCNPARQTITTLTNTTTTKASISPYPALGTNIQFSHPSRFTLVDHLEQIVLSSTVTVTTLVWSPTLELQATTGSLNATLPKRRRPILMSRMGFDTQYMYLISIGHDLRWTELSGLKYE